MSAIDTPPSSVTAPTIITHTLAAEPGWKSYRPVTILEARQTPAIFSSEPGNAARNGVGASFAASGIHEWKGMQPALPSAPASRQAQPIAPVPVIGRPCISLMRAVPAARMVSAMPSISSRSAVPARVSALTAVAGRSRLRSSSMPNNVHNSPSQKNSVSAR